MNDFSLVWHELVYYRKIILQFGKSIGWEISGTRHLFNIRYYNSFYIRSSYSLLIFLFIFYYWNLFYLFNINYYNSFHMDCPHRQFNFTLTFKYTTKLSCCILNVYKNSKPLCTILQISMLSFIFENKLQYIIKIYSHYTKIKHWIF